MGSHWPKDFISFHSVDGNFVATFYMHEKKVSQFSRKMVTSGHHATLIKLPSPWHKHLCVVVVANVEVLYEYTLALSTCEFH
jgi:hypothetical protein